MVIKGQTDEHAVQLEMYDQRPANDEARTAVFILAPPDIAGRGYLARHHADRIPDVLYFSPKTLRLRPLGANAALEGVEQSDLTYRDLDLLQKMQGWSADDVSATLLREERVDGVDTHVIALQPKDQGVADRRLVVWLAEDDLVARQVDIFDDGDATPRRRIHQRQIEMVGNVPVAREVEVESPRERTRTILHIREIKFDSGVDESVFHEDAFKRRVH